MPGHPREIPILTPTTFRACCLLGLATLLVYRAVRAEFAPSPSASQPTTKTALAIPPGEQAFDPDQHVPIDPFGSRKKLADAGITRDPYLVVDSSQNFVGGVNTRSNNFRERFNLPITIDAEKQRPCRRHLDRAASLSADRRTGPWRHLRPFQSSRRNTV
ncbi:MAG TPA: hypothetical protein VG326_04345 [Tepidisphaeraceae bacterium]|nr:hypothetical protein [Tepidisphaeraceae bacterium]